MYMFGIIAGLAKSLLSVQVGGPNFRIVSILCALPSKVWIPDYVFNSFSGLLKFILAAKMLIAFFSKIKKKLI